MSHAFNIRLLPAADSKPRRCCQCVTIFGPFTPILGSCGEQEEKEKDKENGDACKGDCGGSSARPNINEHILSVKKFNAKMF